jgi:hypothetical protein
MPDPNWWNAGPGELRGDHERRARAIGRCKRCEGPYFTQENTISGLCDPCLDRDHDEAKAARAREARRQESGE